jgi:hypothetical protein
LAPLPVHPPATRCYPARQWAWWRLPAPNEDFPNHLSQTICSTLRSSLLAVVLVATAAVLLWAHVAIAALTLCLNETPGLAIGLRDALPASAALAGHLLALAGQAGADPATGGPSCDTTAPARAMIVAGVAYLVGVVVLERTAIPPRARWLAVVSVVAAIQLAMFFMPALLSSDVLDYASHGRVASIYGANPYRLTPSDFPDDPFANQGGWPFVVTVYGPLWTHIDVVVTGLLAGGNNARLAFAYKALGLAGYLASLCLLGWLAGRWGALGATDVSRPVAVALWAWNPLVNVEVVGSAHNEGTMTVFVLLGLAVLTTAVPPGRGSRRWPIAVLCLALGALVKFVPAAGATFVSLVWLRRAPTRPQRLRRALLLAALLLVLCLVVAWPWLDSPAVAGPLLGVAAGGQRFKDPWQDAPAAWLTVRLVPLLGVPDTPATLRMDVARAIMWGLTRALFVAYLGVEVRSLWRWAADRDAGRLLRRIAIASVRCLLLAILLFVSQVYPWYFLWPLPVACLLGVREPWSRAAIVFGLAFLPAYYLREFEPYGVFYLPVYALVALALLALAWVWEHGLPYATIVRAERRDRLARSVETGVALMVLGGLLAVVLAWIRRVS